MGLRIPGTFQNAVRTVSIFTPALFTWSTALFLWSLLNPPGYDLNPPPRERVCQLFLNPQVQDPGANPQVQDPGQAAASAISSLANHDRGGGGETSCLERTQGGVAGRLGGHPEPFPPDSMVTVPQSPRRVGVGVGGWARWLQASAPLPAWLPAPP